MNVIGSLINQLNQLWKKGFFHLAVSNYSVQLIVFSSHLLIAKIMLPDDLGVIKSIETFVSIGVVLGAGGAMLALLKLVPENKDALVRKLILLQSSKSTIFFSVATVLLIFIFIFLGSYTPYLVKAHWYYVYALIIIPATLTQLFTRYYQSTDNFKRISTITFIVKMISAIIVLTSTYYFFIGGYVISMVVTFLVTLFYLLFDLRKELKIPSTAKISTELKDRFKVLTNTAFKSQVIDQLKLNAGFIVAFVFIKDKVEFGNFAFALILVQGLNVLVSSIQQFIIPKLSEISSNLNLFFLKLKQIEGRVSMVAFIVFVAAQLVLPFLIVWVYGEEYLESILLFRIMLVGWLLMTTCSVSGISFVCLGEMKYTSFSATFALMLSLPFIFILTIKYGALGAAISFSIQSFINHLSIRYYLNQLKNSL